MVAASNTEWFAEPQTPDNTWARRGESAVDWLSRSTLPRAQACRQFLNHNLAAMPDTWQPRLVRELRHQWTSAFFELMVARTLQVLGGTLTIEAAAADGKRPDFFAQFPNGTVTVEATSPLINREMGEQLKRRNPLLDMVEAHAPIGWWTNVEEMPDLGLSACRRCKRKIRAAVARLLAVGLPSAGSEEMDLRADLPFGRLRISLLPRNSDPEGRGLGMEPVIGGWSDSKERIKVAVRRKRVQVRSATTPVLIAVNAGGMVSSLDDFDVALFGHTVDMRDRHRRHVGIRFDRDGVFFDNRGGGRPTYAGVLAFLEIGFRMTVDPVLYVHPRFDGSLPAAFWDLEHRTLEEWTTSIRIEPARRTGILKELGLVNV